MFLHWILPAILMVVFLVASGLCLLAAGDPEGRGGACVAPGFIFAVLFLICFGYLLFHGIEAIVGVL